jgi:DNA-directed RNA polymerase subunit M/transcription elongation factor TFIIS
MVYQALNNSNTCPDCNSALMLPYYPHGFSGIGIIQCSRCDYSRETKMVSWKKAKKKVIHNEETS